MRNFTRLLRSCLSLLPLFVLTALVMVATPHRLDAQNPASDPVLAQDSAPTASSASSSESRQAPPSAAAGEQKESAASEEQKELESFTHAPIVGKIGHIFGLDVNTSANVFMGLNFAIIFFALVIPLGKLMPKIIRGRKETLSQNLRTAREATEDAKSRLSAVEAKLAGLGDEIANFRAQVEQDIAEDEKRIKASLAEESARVVAAAEQEIAAAAAQARRGLRTFAADLAIAHAEKQLILTPETDRALIGEFISQVSTNNAGKGGKN